jgi:uncharacterized protein
MKIKKLILPFLFIMPAALLFSQEGARERVVDNAGLLSPGQKGSLIYLLDYVSARYSVDLVIVTENSIGGANPMDYADDFFDYNGYGLGNDRAGCLFLIVTGTRDYWFSTSGRGIKILNPYALKKLKADAVKFLREDNYYAAFNSFLENWEKFMVLDSRNRSYNFFYQWNAVLVLIGWLISLAIGFIVVSIWKKRMNTALLKTQADAYMIPESLAFNVKTDKFLYSVVTKTERPRDDSSSSGGGIHTSSSGRSHGGGGGRY